MTFILLRQRLAIFLGLFVYLLAGLTVTDLQSLQVVTEPAPACPASLLAEVGEAGGAPGGPEGAPVLTVIQGNAWMLPTRPLLLPYAFSTDRKERLEALVDMVRGCRPDVVLLQEVFETAVVDLLIRRLPDYRVITSGESDITGTVNASGLVTLTRLPAGNVRFHEFSRLPPRAKTIERLGRKGFLAVDVVAPGFRGSIVNLHLYASRDATEAGISSDQLTEVVTFAEAERRADRRVLVAGDFNLTDEEMAGLLPEPWQVSRHGPTYDPRRNRYTVEGANNTPGNHEDRRLGRGVKTVDHLINPDTAWLRVRSGVLDRVPLSDHYFLQHVVAPTRP